MSGDDVHEEAAAPCARVGRGSAMSEGALIQRVNLGVLVINCIHNQWIEVEKKILIDALIQGA